MRHNESVRLYATEGGGHETKPVCAATLSQDTDDVTGNAEVTRPST